MNPPEIKWEEKAPGLHCCYVGGSEYFSYHFKENRDGTGWLCKYNERGGRNEGRYVPGIKNLGKAKEFVELDVFYKWMEENQHVWARADK